MENTVKEFETILDEQDKILDLLIVKQAEMKFAVTEKSWEKLSEIIPCINKIYEDFAEKDSVRDCLQDNIKSAELKSFSEKITNLRSKLLKCKIENQALTKYVNITKEFIQGIVENALPQTGSKVYSNKGKILHPQPQSVVVDLSF